MARDIGIDGQGRYEGRKGRGDEVDRRIGPDSQGAGHPHLLRPLRDAVHPGQKGSDDALYDWIVSDFGLTDAIESGLVKTPRVVVRDDALPDARTYKPKLYHIYAASDE